MKINEIKIWKLNILDIMIVLAIFIFVGIYASSHISRADKGAVSVGSNNTITKFTYTISIANLANSSPDMIKLGDEVYDKVSNAYIGKIVEIEASQAVGLIELENGEVIDAVMPGRADVKLKIETEGNIKNGEYLANGLIRIMVGNYREIKTKYLMCSGTVSSIDRVEE